MKHTKEFDNPPLAHTRPMEEPQTRFTRAREKYEGRIGSAVVRAANWRMIAFATIGLATVLGGGLIYASAKPQAIPYYVEVDKTGAVGNITKASQDYTVKEESIQYFIGQTMRNLRSVPKDPVQYRKNGDEANHFITKKGSKKLEELMKDEHQADDIKAGRATDVEIIGISKVAGKNDIYQIRWKEKKYDKNELESEYTMTGFVTVLLAKPKKEENLVENPFGIYIDDISCSKER